MSEEFYVSKGGDYTPAPDGIHAAVCVDLVPMQVRSAFKRDAAGNPVMVDKVQLVFEINALMEDGRRFIVSKLYTPSLSPKANLRKDLKGWRGVDFTAAELEKFNLAQVVGAPCQLVIQHRTDNDGDVQADIVTISRAAAELKLTPSGKYVRRKDRMANQEPGVLANQQMPHNGYAAPTGAATVQQSSAADEKPPF